MANITAEEFNEEFETFNYSSDDPNVIEKLQELCVMYHLDASDVAMEWVAFAHTKKIKMKLTVENLDILDRERLSRAPLKPKNRVKPTGTTIYDVATLQEPVDYDTADALLGAYSTPNSKQGSKKRQHTPEMVQNKRLTTIGRSPVVPFSPSSFSPASATPTQKYSSRKNAGEVVCSFGASAKAPWATSRDKPCLIRDYVDDRTTALRTSFKYMFQKMTDKAHVLNDMIEEMGEALKKRYDITEFSHVALPLQEESVVCGRIACDSNGKLNAQSVVLEGSRETSAGKQIPVDLSVVPQYSLFPGQIVAMEGVNSTGNKFAAKKVFDNVPLPLPNAGSLHNGDISVVIAAGPFTTTESITYEPLADLMTYLQKSPPDVCILLGPFIDAKNPDIEKCFGNTSYDDFFEKTVGTILSATHRTGTEIVLVPSQRDVHSDCVFPQPPFSLLTKGEKTKSDKYKRLRCVSDPCTLEIDGVVFGITSTDILFHLGAEEISCPAGSSDRLARLARHILTQQSYYPLYPAPEEVCVDFDQLEVHARLPITPHVLILPSELRYFIKDIEGCCCVNPGRLSKGQVGGTYARLHISSHGGSTKSLVSQVAAEVLKI